MEFSSPTTPTHTFLPQPRSVFIRSPVQNLTNNIRPSTGQQAYFYSVQSDQPVPDVTRAIHPGGSSRPPTYPYTLAANRRPESSGSTNSLPSLSHGPSPLSEEVGEAEHGLVMGRQGYELPTYSNPRRGMSEVKDGEDDEDDEEGWEEGNHQ